MLNKSTWCIFHFKIYLMSSPDTNRDAEYKFLQKSFHWDLSSSMQAHREKERKTDRQTNGYRGKFYILLTVHHVMILGK